MVCIIFPLRRRHLSAAAAMSSRLCPVTSIHFAAVMQRSLHHQSSRQFISRRDILGSQPLLCQRRHLLAAQKVRCNPLVWYTWSRSFSSGIPPANRDSSESPSINSKGGVTAISKATQRVTSLATAAGCGAVRVAKNPLLLLDLWGWAKDGIVHGYHWTRKGFRLFLANFRISVLLVKKKIKGQPLSFREHKLLVRTTSDSLKLIPFSFFVLIPFAELLLPVALWMWPGMLPSTFAQKKVDQPYLARKLQAKQELAQFFQELVAEKTKAVLEDNLKCDSTKNRAILLKEFQEKLITKAKHESDDTQEVVASDVDPFLSLEETLKYAKLFREEFKLEKMPTKSLMVRFSVKCSDSSLMQYVAISSFSCGMSAFWEQFLHHIVGLQREDREIMWEGVDSLTHDELVDACRERAMRFYGLSDDMMREQMTHWLKLSAHKDIPPLLLLWSRSITMTHQRLSKPKEEVLKTEDSGQATEDLLPIVEMEQGPELREREQFQEERRVKEEQMKADLEEADQKLEKLATAAQILKSKLEGGMSKGDSTTQLESEGASENSLDSILHDPEVLTAGVDDQVDQSSLKERNETLERELHIQHDVSELQHEQVSILIQSLAGLIDEFRGMVVVEPAANHFRETLIKRLELILSTYEAGVNQASSVLELAKDSAEDATCLDKPR